MTSFAHYDSIVTVDAGAATVVHTSSGALAGTTEFGVGVWRGVPYAEQPVGERRFRAPGPLMPWTGVREAIEHGPIPLHETGTAPAARMRGPDRARRA